MSDSSAPKLDSLSVIGNLPISSDPLIDSIAFVFSFLNVITPSPANFTINEGETEIFNVTIANQDDLITLVRIDTLPSFITLEQISDNGTNNISLNLTASPTFSDSGIYTIQYRIDGDSEGSTFFNVQITVGDITPSVNIGSSKKLSLGWFALHRNFN